MAEQETKFECPKCGGYKFGTSNCTSPFEEWVGHCHEDGCDFTWKRTDDDLYFKPVAQNKEKL